MSAKRPNDDAEFADWFADEVVGLDTMTLRQIREFGQTIRKRCDELGYQHRMHIDLTMIVQAQLLRVPSKTLNREESDLRLDVWCEGFGLPLDDYLAARQRNEGGAQ